MDLLEIKYFLKIAAAGGLSRAAVPLGVSQPALSRHIASLEEVLGQKLFYRHGRGVSLTEAGRRFHEVAKNVIQQLSDVQEELSGGSLNDAGSVMLGMPPSLSASMGADLALRFGSAFPSARLRLREAFSAILLEWTELGRVDLAVLYDARSNPSLVASPLLLEDLFLVTSTSGSVIGPPDVPLPLKALTGYPCVLPGPENGLRRVLDAACIAEGVRPTVLTEVDCVASIKQLVERGVGATVLPFGAVHREVSAGSLRAQPFHSPAMRALLVIATPANKPVTPLVRATIKIIQEEVSRLVPLGVLKGVTNPTNYAEAKRQSRCHTRHRNARLPRAVK